MVTIAQSKPFPGAVDHGDGNVSFTIYAPFKQSVHVIGDFNDWSRKNDLLEQHDGLWTLTKQLDSGQYAYRFLVDGEIEITDPYARQIRREPDKPPAAIVDVGKAPYEWKHDQFGRPHFNDLIIMEVLPFDFSLSKDLDGVRERLRYFQELGINALDIMPIFGRDPEDEWGYQPENFFAPHPEYGSPDDLRRFVDESHGRGIAVMLDIVLAHTAHNHAFLKMYSYEDSPWHGQVFGKDNEFGLPSIDQSKPAGQAFCRDVLQFWLREYHIDGYRLDYVNLIDEKDGMGIPKLVQDIREARPDAYILCEMLPEQPEKTSRWDVEGAYHWHFGESLIKLIMDDVAKEKAEYDLWADFLSALDPSRSGYSRPRKMVNYIESHDEQRLVKKLRDAGLPGDEARHRAALAAAILLTAAGEPMLYQAQEWGEKTPMDMDGNPVNWELLGTEGGAGLHAFYRMMIGIRRDHPALRSENFSLEYENGEQQCVVYLRWNDEGNRVLVAANLSPHPHDLTITFPAAGAWHEAVAGERVEVQDTLSLTLHPHAPRVWIKQ